jgi:hypothetical protein
VNLSGVGQAAGAGLSVATAVDFGAENVGTPYQQGINLFNMAPAR